MRDSQQANYFKLGVFVILGLALLAAALVVLGLGQLLQKRVVMETYLDESISGLDIGSVVRYRGVQIGNVKEISFVHTTYPNSVQEGARFVLIRFTVDPEALGAQYKGDIGRVLEREVERGLRARIKAKSITGTSFLEVDYMKPERITPIAVSWKPQHYYLPSVPSTISRFSESLEKILARLEATRFDVLSEDLHDLLATLNTQVKAVDMKGLKTEFSQLIQDADQEIKSLHLQKVHEEMLALLKEVAATNEALRNRIEGDAMTRTLEDAALAMEGARHMVESNQEKVAGILGDLESGAQAVNRLATEMDKVSQSGQIPEMATRLNATIRRMDDLLAREQGNIGELLENLKEMSRDLKALVRDAKRQPSAFFFGEGPERGEEP